VAAEAGVGVKTTPGAGKWLGGVGSALVFLTWGGAPWASAQAPVLPRTYLLIVTGVSGEPRFASAAQQAAVTMYDAATSRWGIPDAQVTWLAEDPARDPGRAHGKATRQELEGAIARAAAAMNDTDRLFLLLLGHGSSQDGIARFNLVGPDMTAAELAHALEAAKGTVVVVNTASSSGGFTKALAGRNRMVVTATKSAEERNVTVFATYFVKALTGDGADQDKDGRVSLLEAFQYARREVEREYDQAGKLLTEHAVLDDDGDGIGHADAGEQGPDGLRARRFYLAPSASAVLAATDSRAAALLVERAQLEARLDSLRARKTGMAEDAYQTALEGLLVRLAQVNQALKGMEPRKP